MRVLILTPFMAPSVGGAAVYTELLTDILLALPDIEEIRLVTEAHPERPAEERLADGRLVIERWFPVRAGVSRREASRYLKYAVQNLHYLRLPGHIRRHAITHVLVHSSLHNNPSLLDILVPVLRRGGRTRLICDLRDTKLPSRKLRVLDGYDAIISCSRLVTEHVLQRPALRSRLHEIPIPLRVTPPRPGEVEDALARYGLTRGSYLYFTGGIDYEKGSDLLLAAAAILRRNEPEFALVVAGKQRDWRSEYQAFVDAGWLRPLGPIPHRDALLLSVGSRLDINCTRYRFHMSFPRGSAEARLMGARVLFPQGVPELEEACPEYVVSSSEPAEIAAQAQRVMGAEVYAPAYDFRKHEPEQLRGLYEAALKDRRGEGV